MVLPSVIRGHGGDVPAYAVLGQRRGRGSRRGGPPPRAGAAPPPRAQAVPGARHVPHYAGHHTLPGNLAACYITLEHSMANNKDPI